MALFLESNGLSRDLAKAACKYEPDTLCSVIIPALREWGSSGKMVEELFELEQKELLHLLHEYPELMLVMQKLHLNGCWTFDDLQSTLRCSLETQGNREI